MIQGNAQLLFVHPGLPPETRDKVARIRAATETIAGLTHRIAALRDIVTVDYPAGNRTTVPMVNFRASPEAGEAKGLGAEAAAGGGAGAPAEGAPGVNPTLRVPGSDTSNRKVGN